MSAPLLGYFDPEYFKIMDEVMDLLRYVFQTKNQVTFSVPATGGAGMEAALVNVIEPGDNVVVGVTGFFAGRMVEIAKRCGAKVFPVTTEWGKAIDLEEMQKALETHKPKVVATVHGETSTGVEQPVAEIGRMVRDAGAYMVLDTVASLGGPQVKVDEWLVDVCYSGSQKCLSAPPGLAPITFSDRAVQMIRSRKTPVQSWYFDITMHERYWIDPRVYHHTGPALMVFALREALRLVYEEGLEARERRHQVTSDALVAGLTAMGLKMFADPAHRLSSVTSVWIPDGVDDMKIRRGLLNKFNIEITGGLGDFKGKMWRIGLMGYSCKASNVLLFLAALETLLRAEGVSVPSGIQAAGEIITKA
ncbi:MAG: alanine--glyoxylate aminotransferase family protein [Chloroflexi bacterium]|nr:alanine--glyoxylate aminotransferase family protein [Chloroflexota bacterium]